MKYVHQVLPSINNLMQKNLFAVVQLDAVHYGVNNFHKSEILEITVILKIIITVVVEILKSKPQCNGTE